MKIISLIIPVYNEEKLVGQLLEKVGRLDFSHLGYDKELVIVNDGSKDKSEEAIKAFIAEYKGEVQYLSHTNHGKGYSIKQGVIQATGDVYVIQDADLEYEPHDLISMLQKMEKKGLDVCYGSRTRGYASYGAHYSTLGFLFGGLAVSFLTSLLTLRIISDEPTCYKMYKKKCKELLLYPKENDFAWEPAVTMLLIKNHYSYGEIPIHYYPRKHAQGKKIKLIDGWLAIKTLFVYRYHSITHHA